MPQQESAARVPYAWQKFDVLQSKNGRQDRPWLDYCTIKDAGDARLAVLHVRNNKDKEGQHIEFRIVRHEMGVGYVPVLEHCDLQSLEQLRAAEKKPAVRVELPVREEQAYRMVTTTQLNSGDLVNCHGSLFRLGARRVYATTPASRVIQFDCEYLGPTWQDSPEVIPAHWRADWIVQGNELAHWAVHTLLPRHLMPLCPKCDAPVSSPGKCARCYL